MKIKSAATLQVHKIGYLRHMTFFRINLLKGRFAPFPFQLKNFAQLFVMIRRKIWTTLSFTVHPPMQAKNSVYKQQAVVNFLRLLLHSIYCCYQLADFREDLNHYCNISTFWFRLILLIVYGVIFSHFLKLKSTNIGLKNQTSNCAQMTANSAQRLPSKVHFYFELVVT